MKNRLAKAKRIIKAYFSYGSLGLYDTSNWCGDLMTMLYKDDEFTISICYDYEYFEVIGLTAKEFNELENYYESL